MKHLDLRITERARAWIEEYLSGYEAESLLALTYGSLKTYTDSGVPRGESSTRWRFVVFTKAQAEEIERTSSLTGEGVYVTPDGITLCIPEANDLDRLIGKTLDAANGALLVNER